MDKSREHDLVWKYHSTKDPEFIAAIIRLHHRYIAKLVNKEYKAFDKMVEWEDLYQEAVSGLITAIHRFDFDKNVKIMSYATLWMRTFMFQRWLETMPVHIPAHRVRKFHYFKATQEELDYLNGVLAARPLDILIDENTEDLKIKHYSRNYTEELFEKKFLDKHYMDALASMSDFDRNVFVMHTGCLDGSNYQIREIAEVLNTEQRECDLAYKRAKRIMKNAILKHADSLAA